MRLDELPVELVLEVCDYLPQVDAVHLGTTSTRLRSVLIDLIYRSITIDLCKYKPRDATAIGWRDLETIWGGSSDNANYALLAKVKQLRLRIDLSTDLLLRVKTNYRGFRNRYSFACQFLASVIPAYCTGLRQVVVETAANHRTTQLVSYMLDQLDQSVLKNVTLNIHGATTASSKHTWPLDTLRVNIHDPITFCYKLPNGIETLFIDTCHHTDEHALRILLKRSYSVKLIYLSINELFGTSLQWLPESTEELRVVGSCVYKEHESYYPALSVRVISNLQRLSLPGCATVTLRHRLFPRLTHLEIKEHDCMDLVAVNRVIEYSTHLIQLSLDGSLVRYVPQIAPWLGTSHKLALINITSYELDMKLFDLLEVGRLILHSKDKPRTRELAKRVKWHHPDLKVSVLIR